VETISIKRYLQPKSDLIELANKEIVNNFYKVWYNNFVTKPQIAIKSNGKNKERK